MGHLCLYSVMSVLMLCREQDLLIKSTRSILQNMLYSAKYLSYLNAILNPSL